MLRNIFAKTLYDQRRSLIWWSVGIILLALYLAFLYPSVRDNAATYDNILKAMPEALAKSLIGEFSSYASPDGYLNSSIFFLSVPLLFLIYTIGQGSGAVAGEEERGTMDLLLGNPLPRWRVVVDKFGAQVVGILLLAFAFWASLLIGAVFVKMDINAGRLAAVTFSGVLLGLVFGALALALGCIRGDRGLSIGVASSVAVATYFLNSLATSAKWLEPYRKLSPFYYYIGADPLVNGLNLGHAAVLLGLIVVLLAVALLAFQRRDVAV